MRVTLTQAQIPRGDQQKQSPLTMRQRCRWNRLDPVPNENVPMNSQQRIMGIELRKTCVLK